MEVSCELVRESISAGLDGETAGLPDSEVERHLAGCDACRFWQEAAHEVTRQFRLQAAEDHGPAPAALRATVVATAPRRRPTQITAARMALVAVGVAQLLVTGRVLLSGDIDSFRDLAALEVALGVGYLVAAARPRRAVGMRSIVGTAALLLLGSAALDLVHHRTTIADEAPHLIAVTGWLLIMFLAWRTPELGAPPWALRQWMATPRRALRSAGGRRAAGWGDTTTSPGPAFSRARPGPAASEAATHRAEIAVDRRRAVGA